MHFVLFWVSSPSLFPIPAARIIACIYFILNGQIYEDFVCRRIDLFNWLHIHEEEMVICVLDLLIVC